MSVLYRKITYFVVLKSLCLVIHIWSPKAAVVKYMTKTLLITKTAIMGVESKLRICFALSILVRKACTCDTVTKSWSLQEQEMMDKSTCMS